MGCHDSISFQMDIQVKASGLPSAKKFRQLATARLAVALGRVGHAVQSVSVRLCDMKRPGGADKLCRVVLQMKNRFVVLEELGADMNRVIERAALRTRHVAYG